ncbi:hypothetical protein HN681_04950 [archaeon]|nr:hypothetical protein [Candidatus Woesearchaeota archaeon]MBT6837680.1 hypothetical protein [Bacteroidota bacterium]MBT7380069.1 hypothetical protein [archaeon]MBT8010766.1 hypothetical protein [archaeon]
MAKKKGGWVYSGVSTRKNGSKKNYTGMTRKSPLAREKEHQREVSKPNSKTWVGKGTSYKTKSSFWSKNPEKAEKTVKRKPKKSWW